MLYIEPKMEILTFVIEDVIRTSADQVEDQGNQDPNAPKNDNDLGGWV